MSHLEMLLRPACWTRASVRPVTTPRAPAAASARAMPKEHVRKSRRWLGRRYTGLVYFNEGTAGGHFAAMEQPDILVADIRKTFEALR
jgi:hypothetical protein